MNRKGLQCRILIMAFVMILLIFIVNFYFLGVISEQPNTTTTFTHLDQAQQLQNIIANIQYALTPRKHVSLATSWDIAKSWVSKDGIYSLNDNMLGNIMHSMRTAKILRAEDTKKGTQLKLLLKLAGKQSVLFKPKWYDRQHIINGSVYSGKDRHNGEVVAFYLSMVLNMRWVPVAVLRLINAKTEMLDVASTSLKETIVTKGNNTLCVYGKCHFCRRDEPVCANEDGYLEGAIILLLDEKLTKFNSKWQRTYVANKKAEWEKKTNYCGKIKNSTSPVRMLDFVDTAIFDFLLQNGDRHHYETIMNRIILLDNGKTLGNPYKDSIDILAPLYQCCIIRKKTWDRLTLLSGSLSSVMRDLLKHEPGEELLTETHIEAFDRRLDIVYQVVDRCISQHGKSIFKYNK